MENVDPKLIVELEKILDENTAGDPMSLLRWTNKSTLKIAEELGRMGHHVSHDTVRRKIREMGYSLQSNVKTKEGKSPEERDAQFRYINQQVKRFIARGDPVLSIDTKKKERIGEFKNAGRTWRHSGEPEEVNIYDFPSLGIGTAVPYGAYDIAKNKGFVNVGVSHDTAEFAVESLRRWWRMVGRRWYPDANRLLLCADAGGSNGTKNRAWKYFLQKWTDEDSLRVTVYHYPPGTSKWNKIEHRMFSFISMNWKGRPLVDYQTVVSLIGATATKTGLRVRAMLDRREYVAGLKIDDKEMEQLNVKEHPLHPQWNYTIEPRKARKE